MRADRALHAENNKSLTWGRQECQLGLTQSHRLIVPRTKTPVLQMSYKQQGAEPGPNSFHWYRLTQLVFADCVETEPGYRLQRNNRGGLRKK